MFAVLHEECYFANGFSCDKPHQPLIKFTECQAAVFLKIL